MWGVEIEECKKKELYIIECVLIIIIIILIYAKTVEFEENTKMLIRGASIFQIVMIVTIVGEAIREFKFGEIIHILEFKVEVNKINYNKRIEYFRTFQKKERRLVIEAIEYLIMTEYKYEKYNKKIIGDIVTISGVLMFFNNIVVSFGNVKNMFMELSVWQIKIIFDVLVLSLVLIYFFRRKNLIISEKNNKINKMLNKVLYDLKYYDLNKKDLEEYNYYL